MRYPMEAPGRGSRPDGGRLAQRESASFTPRRSLVRSQYRPPGQRLCGSSSKITMGAIPVARAGTLPAMAGRRGWGEDSVLCVPGVPPPAGIPVSRSWRMARQRGEREITGQLRERSRVSRISAATAPEGVQSGGLKSSTGQDVVEVAGQLDRAAGSPGALSEVMRRSHVPGQCRSRRTASELPEVMDCYL